MAYGLNAYSCHPLIGKANGYEEVEGEDKNNITFFINNYINPGI